MCGAVEAQNLIVVESGIEVEGGFNTEVTEKRIEESGWEKFASARRLVADMGRSMLCPYKQMRLDRVCRRAYKHQRAKNKTKPFDRIRGRAKYSSLEPLKHVYAA